ncbi:aminoglycoside phosphotransferase family protein [Marinilactibacillus sp. GCM10026970]|uniref:aminoglycoside phosphotransferase family protein n=1 Tax=Marinilactibacillus sp. GCM10026970 TaxID=3252642 RepID=UPI00361D096F
MTKIPENFKEIMVKNYGSKVENWVNALPNLLSKSEEIFNIHHLRPFEDLSYNYVADGMVGHLPVVLKLSFEKEALKREKDVLKAFEGRGTVRVLDYNEKLGALLLEKVVPGKSLANMGEDQKEVKQFCQVFKRLHQTQVNVNSEGVPTLVEWFAALKRYREIEGTTGDIPEEEMTLAEILLEELIQTTIDPVLMHGDLHHGNILENQGGGWKVIDPKGLFGDIHFETIQYLLNYIDRQGDPDIVLERRIQWMSSYLNLDQMRIIKWGVVRGILEACWALENGEDLDKGLEITNRFRRRLRLLAEVKEIDNNCYF